MYAQPVQAVHLQDLGFSLDDFAKSISQAANEAEKVAKEIEPIAKTAYKETKNAGKLAGKAAPVISAVAGDEYGEYATQFANIVDMMPLNLQNLEVAPA